MRFMNRGIRVWSVFRDSFKAFIRFYPTNIKTMKYVKLSQTEDVMPTLGLGTWQVSISCSFRCKDLRDYSQSFMYLQAPSDIIESIVYKALDLGYRHIDTAFNYNNEEAIGKAIKKWIDDGKGVRKDLFITTKVIKKIIDT